MRVSMRKSAVLCFAVSLAVVATSASAAGLSGGVVKIGVLGDMSGVYSTGYSGAGAVAAVKMAVKDFGGKVLGKPIKVVSADHQNKPAVASSIARKWIDQNGVDMITDLTMSAAALAVQKLASEKGVITISTGAASSLLTNQDCSKYGIHYGYDTNALAIGTATGVVKNGGKSWFFLTVDYAFGHSLQDNTAGVVKKLGGTVVGSVLHPLGTTDFASYLLQAKSSGAQVIALANAGQDTVNSVKQAHSFRVGQGNQQLVALLLLLSNVKAIGLQTAQGLQFTSGWYWNHDKASREWTKRYEKVSDGAAPTFTHAALYSATMAYLNAIKAAGTDNSDAVRKELGEMTIDDFFAKGGHIRPDGLLVHDMYLLKVKKPSDSKSSWDLAKVVRTIPADQAYPPLSASKCPLLKK